MDKEDDHRVDTVTDSDEAPPLSKNKRRKAKRGITGKNLSEFKPGSADNNDVDDIPGFSKDKEAPDDKQDGGKSRPRQKRVTPENSRFFGVKPTDAEVAEVKEYLELAQAMIIGGPILKMETDAEGKPIFDPVRTPDGIIVPGQFRPRIVAVEVSEFKTKVFEFNDDKKLVPREVTYSYKIAKLLSIGSVGMVGKLENWAEENPFKACLVVGATTAFSFANTCRKLKAEILRDQAASAATQNHSPSVSPQSPPINNRDEAITVTKVAE